MVSEKVRWAKLVWDVGHRFPYTKRGNENKANNQRGDDRYIRAGLISSVDDAHQSKADARDDECATNVVETSPCFVPRDALRVLGRLVECKDGCEGEELCDKTAPVDVLPAATINRVLQVH